MSAFQLPDSVTGSAVACLVYSVLCLFLNCVLVWLIFTHHERTSYVAFIAYFTLLATVSSLVQQLYDYILWQDIMTWQFTYSQEHAHDAEVQYQNGIFGLKLALAKVRIFSFIVESSLVFFFSLSLASTVYGWWARNPRMARTISIIGRVGPITLAVISIVLLQFEFMHQSFFAYMAVANTQYILSLVGACIFLLMILYKYLQSRWQLQTWGTVQYGKGGSRSTMMMGNSTVKSGKSGRSRAWSGASGKRVNNATVDNWLVVRLTIAFLALCAFEYTNVSPRLKSRENVLETLHETEPDLSHKRAMSTVTGYLSGVSPSMLAFLVFGTTKQFQRKMYVTFVPAFIRNRGKPDSDDDEFFGCRQPAHHSAYLNYKAGLGTNNSSGIRASTATTVNSKSPRFAHRSMSSSSGPGNLPPLQIPAYPGSPNMHAARGSPISANSPNFARGGGSPSIFTPPSPQFTLSHKGSKSSLRSTPPQLPLVLNPIYEPKDESWALDTLAPEPSHLRHSQIGLALSKSKTPSPEPPSSREGPRITTTTTTATTFLRDDSESDYTTPSPATPTRAVIAVPLSRFASTTRSPQPQPPPPTLHREPSMTTMIWSEGQQDQQQRRSSSRKRSSSRNSSSHRHHRRFSSATRDTSTAPGRLTSSRQGN